MVSNQLTCVYWVMFVMVMLVNCYADRFFSHWKYASLGCHFANCYVGCIMYADDLLLLSSSALDVTKKS